MEKQRLRHIDPRELKNHPLNIELYGSGDDDEALGADIKRRGVQETLRATADGLLVSGHRRRLWAIKHELKTVPVIFDATLTDDLDIREAVILSNRLTRERTLEQRAREFAELERIEAERGKARRAEKVARNLKKGKTPGDGPMDSQASPSGKAQQKAAKAVGLKPTTARAAKSVVKEIDQLETAGQTEQAQQAREALNDGRVAEAGRIATGGQPDATGEVFADAPDVDRFGTPIPDGPPRAALAFGKSKEFANALSAIRFAKGALKLLGEGPGREVLPIGLITTDLDNARRGLRFGIPFCVCPHCIWSDGQPVKKKPGLNSDTCGACGGRLWITEAAYQALPPELKRGPK